MTAFAAAIVFVVAGVVVATWSVPAGAPGAVPPLPRLGAVTDVYDGDIGDPFVLHTVSGAPTFVMFGTDDWPAHIPTATSGDATVWRPGPDAVPTLPSWANPDPDNSLTWAPAATVTAQGYLLYVSVQVAASRRECIAVLSSPTPLGPYHDAVGHPLVCQLSLGGSIDPSVVVHDGLHLVWKSDGNCCGLPSSLWEQDLRPDGSAVTGTAHRLLTADRPWQGGIVENPAMITASAGGWWLFYSGNRFDVAAYATGLAYCAALTGPCRETAPGPFLAGTFLAGAVRQYSPGGLDFFRDGRGVLWATFATWNRPSRNGRFYCCRSVNAAPIVSS